MRIMFLILLLAVTALGQDGLKTKPRAVAPVHVTLTVAEDKSPDKEFYDSIRRELNTRRNIAVASSSGRADFDVYGATTPIVADGRTVGYAAAVLVMIPDARTRYRVELWVETGPTLEGIARHAAAKMDTLFKGEKK